MTNAAGPTLDLRAAEYVADPYPTLARFRATDPVHMDGFGVWYVLRHADVHALNRDVRLGRDLRKWMGYPLLRPYLADSPLERCVERWMFSLDAPQHTRLRKLVARAFTPRAVEAMHRDIEREADDLLDRLAAGAPEGVELLSGFAQAFPIRVIARVLGLSLDVYEALRRWSGAIAKVLEPTARKADRLTANAGVIEMTAYLLEQVSARRERRTNDVVSILLAAEDDGDRLTEDELVAQLVMMFVAGHETTTNLIGNGMLALARHPQQLERLRSDSSLLPSAIEEMLRFESPANTNARVTHEEIVVGDKTIGAGQLVMCMLGAANRDPEVFADPDRFDVARTSNPHQSFGGGVHFCIGAPLARLEARIAFERLLRRWPEIHVDESGVRWRPLVNLRGLGQLPLRVAWA